MNPKKSPKTVKKLIYLILIFCLSFQYQTNLGATPNDDGNIKFGVAFLLGFPQSEFADNVENNGYGLNVSFDYTFPQSPFSIGFSGGFLIYGQETRREPFSLPDVTVEVTRSNTIVPINLYFRVVPATGAVLPYVEGLVGLNYLFTETETSIKDIDEFDEDRALSRNLLDVLFSYGVGGGFMFRVYQKNKNQGRTRSTQDEDEDKVSSVYINLGLRYRKGGEAEYLQIGVVIAF